MENRRPLGGGHITYKMCAPFSQSIVKTLGSLATYDKHVEGHVIHF